MSSVRDRQRAAARAKLEREMAARAEAARRRRLLQARIGAGVAGLLVLGALVWIISAVSGGGEPATAPNTTTCAWNPIVDPSVTPQPTLGPEIKDVGTPPTTVPNAGYQTMTITTNLGVIKVEMDLSKTPCTAASFTHLAARKFYDNTPCFRLVPSISALQCGALNNTGGPTYRFANEYLPTNNRPWYNDGDLALANSDQQGMPSQGTNGSQFFFIYNTIDVDGPLQPNYSIIGRVIEGQDIVKKVAAAGLKPGSADEGSPKTDFTIKSLTVSEPSAEPAPTPTPTATPTSSAAAPTPSPSATPTPSPS